MTDWKGSLGTTHVQGVPIAGTLTALRVSSRAFHSVAPWTAPHENEHPGHDHLSCDFGSLSESAVGPPLICKSRLLNS